mgnify:CR=1 FL=1|tara:strand:+ start:2333 stop:4435 length:2103 start_codon:yes stop_codon:yes gene_type:complete
MGLIKESLFQNDFGKYFKLNLYDSTYSGTSTDFFLSDRGFDLEYQTKDRTRFTGVIPSKLTFDYVHTSSADDTIIDNIKSAPYKRFQLEVLISDDGSSFDEYWCGNVLSDVSRDQNLSYLAGKKTTITVTDGLAQLIDVKVDDNNSYNLNQLTNFVDYIRLCLLNDVGTSFCWGASDRFLQTMVNWWTDFMPSAAQNIDPLRQCGAIFRAFKEIEDGESVTISSFDMLDRICTAFGARLFLSKGQWRFHQVNSFAQMSSGQYRRSYYKGANTIIASGADDNIVTSGGNILGGGTFDTLPPVQAINLKYDFVSKYQLLVDPIVLWNTWTNNSGVTGTLTSNVYRGSTSLLSQSLGDINQETNSSLSWNLFFRPNYFGTLAQWNTSAPYAHERLDTKILARLKLVGDSGTTYYLNISSYPSSGYVWTTSSTFVGVRTIYNGEYGDYFSYSGNAASNSLISLTGESIDGTHDAIPDSGELFFESYGRFTWVNMQNTTATTNVSSSMSVYPNATTQLGLALGCPTPDGTNEFIKYLVNGQAATETTFTATQPTSVSTIILEGSKQGLGTGPNAMSNTRIICYSNTALTAFDDGTNNTWQVHELTTGDGVTGTITKILGKEILSGRKTGSDVFNGALKREDFEFYQAYSNIDGSKVFVPQEINFNAAEGIWDGQWIQITLDSTGQTYGSSDFFDDDAFFANFDEF